MQFSSFVPVVIDVDGDDNQAIADEISKAMEAAYATALEAIIAKVVEKGNEIHHKLEPVIQGMFIVPATAEKKYICTICLTGGARDITAEQMMQQQAMQQQQMAQRRGSGMVIPELRGVMRGKP